MTERTPLEDHDVIELLRRVTPEPSPLDVDALLARSHRSVTRRRAASLSALTAGVAAAAVAVGLLVGPGVGRTGTLPAVPAGRTTTGASTPSTASTASTPSTPSTPFTPSTSSTSWGGPRPSGGPTSLLAVFGAGWEPDTPSAGGFSGDIRVRAASSDARGLPAGYDASVRLMSFSDPAAFPLDSACRGLTEKGTVTSPCSPVTAPDGTTRASAKSVHEVARRSTARRLSRA